MKFNIGDVVYYVSPFVFTIERVKIDFMHEEYYCDETYAMFLEADLFETLEEAVFHSIKLLNDFYNKKMAELHTINEPPFTYEDKSWN